MTARTVSSPKPRGSILRRPHRDSNRRLYPISGVNPDRLRASARPQCLPRQCGGQSFAGSEGIGTVMSTPLTRGSIRYRPTQPLHLGRLPREHGDQSKQSETSAAVQMSTSKPRGSIRVRDEEAAV
jgi:hypothetical protein